MNSEEKTGVRRPRPEAVPANKRQSAQRKKRTAPKKADAVPKKRRPAKSVEVKKHRKKAADTAAERRRLRRRVVPADNPKRQRDTVPEVVYTPPKQFSRNRFLLQMITMVAVVVALVFVSSIFFKVKTIRVAGAVKYGAWTVREASGIEEDDGLLTFGQAKAAGKIRTALPYVKDVRVGIKLPDTVNIEIVEYDVVYSVEAVDGTWWLMTAEGKILEKIDSQRAAGVTMITGIELEVPVGNMAVVHEEIMQNAFGETIPASVTAQERIDVVKQILQNLEMNGVMGEVSLVDVSVPSDMQMWYGEKYQIKLGDSSRLAHKIESMQSVFLQQEYLEAGIVDVSFTDEERPNQVIFVPFVE